MYAVDDRLDDLDQWQRSKKGNRWRRWHSWTLTVFQCRDGRFGWCIGTAEGPTFGRKRFETEGEAVKALRLEVERREWE